MSSSTYSTVLSPERRLRHVVLLCGIVTVLLGVVTALTLSASVMLRLLLAITWFAFSLRELSVIAAGFRRCRRIRIDASGDIAIEVRQGCWQRATLRRGSVVLNRFAWLRIEATDGARLVELLSGNCRKNKEWRRFQVIWRHLGAVT